jgi:hypothetical protein
MTKVITFRDTNGVPITKWAATVKRRTVARFARGNISAQSARILMPEEQEKEHGAARKILLKWASRARRD